MFIVGIVDDTMLSVRMVPMGCQSLYSCVVSAMAFGSTLDAFL